MSDSHPTLQSNYNFRHTRFVSRVVHACFSVDREIIARALTISHACKTRMIPTRAIFTRVPYIFRVSQN